MFNFLVSAWHILYLILLVSAKVAVALLIGTIFWSYITGQDS